MEAARGRLKQQNIKSETERFIMKTAVAFLSCKTMAIKWKLCVRMINAYFTRFLLTGEGGLGAQMLYANCTNYILISVIIILSFVENACYIE